MTMDVIWPGEDARFATLIGAARDAVTAADGSLHVLASDSIVARTDERLILDVVADPPRAELAALAGTQVGGSLREAIASTLAEEKQAGSLLHLLIDNLAAVTLVGRWGWLLWRSDPAVLRARSALEGVCMGFRPGSEGLRTDREHEHEDARGLRVEPLVDPADPAGWHPLIDHARMTFRRARWIDVWHEDGDIRIVTGFQDSANPPDGGKRVALHEYRVEAIADAQGVLRSLRATPGTLPFKECPAAMANIDVLLGLPLAALREEVPRKLRRTAGCTHMNDMLRALADVPSLAAISTAAS